MYAFPFTGADWQKVADACRLVVSASTEDDAVLEESQFAELAAVFGDCAQNMANIQC